MEQNNRGAVKECTWFPFLVTFALLYSYIPFKSNIVESVQPRKCSIVTKILFLSLAWALGHATYTMCCLGVVTVGDITLNKGCFSLMGGSVNAQMVLPRNVSFNTDGLYHFAQRKDYCCKLTYHSVYWVCLLLGRWSCFIHVWSNW